MSNVKKTLQMTSLLFGMAVLFCYIGWHLGYEGFIIVGDINIPYAIEQIIRFVLLTINLSLYGGFVLRQYNWKILFYSVPFAILEAIRYFFAPWLASQITTGFIPIVIFLFVSIGNKTTKRTILSILLLDGSIILHNLYQACITQTPLTYDISLYTALRLNIDGILLNLLFYSIGGVKHGHESLVFPGRTRDHWDRDGSCQADPESAGNVPVDKFERWVMRSVIGAIQIIQWMFILWICNLDNLFLDALVMTTSFICHGMIISKRQHLKPVILCTLAATAMFYVAARFTISFQYSQFFPIVIGLALTYTLYRVSYQFDQAAAAKTARELERIEMLERKISKAWDQIEDLY